MVKLDEIKNELDGLEISPFHLQLTRDLCEIHGVEGDARVQMARTVARLFGEHERGGTCLLLNDNDWRPSADDEFFRMEKRAAGDYLYFQRYWAAEEALKAKLAAMTGSAADDAEPVAAAFKFKGGWGYNAEQIAAVKHALAHRFTIVTGGPGTGKTTVVFAVLAEVFKQNPDARVALAAPTGKAAQRMSDAIRASLAEVAQWPDGMDGEAITAKIEALQGQTYHRLLHYSPATNGFTFNAENPLPFEVVIVDEASMIDLVHAQALFDAVGGGTKLILLGDPNQLPSVDEGTVLVDLLSKEWGFSGAVASLTEAHRFKDPMKALVTAVNKCDATDPAAYEKLAAEHGALTFTGAMSGSGRGANPFELADAGANVYLWDSATTRAEVQRVAEEWWSAFGRRLKRLCGEFDPTGDGAAKQREEILKILSDAQILTVVRKGSWGCEGINRKLMMTIGGQKEIVQDIAGVKPFVGLPVIITKNDAALGLNNGDVGVIVRAPGEEASELKVLIVGRDELLSSRVLPEYEPAYALTIHKSQGSQYANVLVVLPPPNDGRAEAPTDAAERWSPLMTKELVYTGITRAKCRAFVYGTREGLFHALSHPARRQTGRLAE